MALDTPTTTVDQDAEAEAEPEPQDKAPSRAVASRVTVKRPLSPGARFALVVLAAVAVGFVLRLLIGLTDDAPATDVTAYLRSGISLADGEGFKRDGAPELHFPPLVPFLFSLTSQVFDDPHDGVIALTCLSSTLIIVPLAMLSRRAAGPVAGMITAWVAALAPGLSTTLVNRGGGSEAEYALLVVSALWLLAAAADQKGRRRAGLAALSGLCVGLAYLTRPEGLMIALPLGIGLVLLVVRDARNRGGWRSFATFRSMAGLGAAFALPIAICIAPYAYYLHENTDSWKLSAKTQDASIEAWRGVANNDRLARDKVLYAVDESGLRFTAGRHSLMKLAKEDPGGYAGIVGTNVRRFFEETLLHESTMFLGCLLLPLPLWILAGVGAWRFRRSRTVRLLLAVSAFPVLTTLVFFVQPRYLVVLTALATVLVGAGISVLSDRWRRWALGGVMVLLLVSCVQAFQGGPRWWHPYDQTDQRLAGEWIEANTDPDARIMTRSMVAEFYSERKTMAIPYADVDTIIRFGEYYCADYLVVDWYTVTHLRPQLMHLQTLDSAPGFRLVHEVEAEGRGTRVFAFDPQPIGPCAPIGSSLGFVGDGPPAAEG